MARMIERFIQGSVTRAAKCKTHCCVPVLLCSGYSEEEMCHRFSADDMATFLQKPYPFDVFRARLRALLERSSVH